MNDDLILPDSDVEPAEAEFAQRIRTFALDKIAPHARRIDEDTAAASDMRALH